MRALWSDRPNCSHSVSQKVNKEKSKGIFQRVFCLPVIFGGFGVP